MSASNVEQAVRRYYRTTKEQRRRMVEAYAIRSLAKIRAERDFAERSCYDDYAHGRNAMPTRCEGALCSCNIFEPCGAYLELIQGKIKMCHREGDVQKIESTSCGYGSMSMYHLNCFESCCGDDYQLFPLQAFRPGPCFMEAVKRCGHDNLQDCSTLICRKEDTKGQKKSTCVKKERGGRQKRPAVNPDAPICKDWCEQECEIYGCREMHRTNADSWSTMCDTYRSKTGYKYYVAQTYMLVQYQTKKVWQCPCDCKYYTSAECGGQLEPNNLKGEGFVLIPNATCDCITKDCYPTAFPHTNCKDQTLETKDGDLPECGNKCAILPTASGATIPAGFTDCSGAPCRSTNDFAPSCTDPCCCSQFYYPETLWRTPFNMTDFADKKCFTRRYNTKLHAWGGYQGCDQPGLIYIAKMNSPFDFNDEDCTNNIVMFALKDIYPGTDRFANRIKCCKKKCPGKGKPRKKVEQKVCWEDTHKTTEGVIRLHACGATPAYHNCTDFDVCKHYPVIAFKLTDVTSNIATRTFRMRKHCSGHDDEIVSIGSERCDQRIYHWNYPGWRDDNFCTEKDCKDLPEDCCETDPGHLIENLDKNVRIGAFIGGRDLNNSCLHHVPELLCYKDKTYCKYVDYQGLAYELPCAKDCGRIYKFTLRLLAAKAVIDC